MSHDPFVIAAKRAGCSPRSSPLTPIARTCSCSPCRAAACPSRMKWRARSTRPWTSFSCASWASPATRNWRWAPSRQAACACSTTRSCARLRIPDHVIDAVAAWEQQELARRERLYRGDRPPPDVRGRTVILVDDGLATGATMHAAVKALRQQQPARIVVAVPTAAPETCEAVESGGRRGHLRHHAGAVLRRRPLVRGLLADHGRRGARPARAATEHPEERQATPSDDRHHTAWRRCARALTR